MKGVFSKKFVLTIAAGSCAAYLAHKNDRLIKFPIIARAAEKRSENENNGKPLSELEPNTADMKLKNVQIIFRHGARTPLNVVPQLENEAAVAYDKQFLCRNVPHTNISIQVQGLQGGERPPALMDDRYRQTVFKGGACAGMLTSYGRQQMFELGQQYKKEYIESCQFLSSSFKPEDVFLRSSNINRTIESLQCVLSGMYGAKSVDSASPAVIKVSNHESEVLYPNQRFCEALRQSNKLLWTKEDEFPGMLEMKETIRKHFSWPDPPSEVDLSLLRDNLHSRQAHGLHIPKFLDAIAMDIERLITHWFTVTLCGPESEREWTMRLAIGPVFEMIQHNIEQVKKGRCNYKMHLYSAHDSTLYPMLVALGLGHLGWPTYGADIRVELYEDKDKQFWVRTRYCGDDLVPAGCTSALMSLEKFKEVIAPVAIAPDKWWCQCQTRSLGTSLRPSGGRKDKLIVPEHEREEKLMPDGM